MSPSRCDLTRAERLGRCEALLDQVLEAVDGRYPRVSATTTTVVEIPDVLLARIRELLEAEVSG